MVHRRGRRREVAALPARGAAVARSGLRRLPGDAVVADGVHPVARAFDSVADLYERARPGYPPEAVAFLASRLGLRSGRTVADLGAGTGKLTRELVATGARVVAVEPLEEMRATLQRVVPAAEAIAGTAEAIPLPDGSCDAVTAAQAFHWFDEARALPEIHRVLVPGGALALVWNSRELDDPLQAAVEALIAPYRDATPFQFDRAWHGAVEASPLYGPIEYRSFRWSQPFTRAELAERVASTSVVAALGPDERESLLDRVRAAADGLEEPFPFRYTTEVSVIPVAEAGAGGDAGAGATAGGARTGA